MQIKGVRLPRDGDAETGRLKGFGYADFEDRASLVEALSMNEHTLKNRKLRIDLAAGGRGNDRDGGRDGRRPGGRYDYGRDGEEDRTAGDWRSGPPAEDRPSDRDRGERRGYEPPRERPSYGDRDSRDRGEPASRN